MSTVRRDAFFAAALGSLFLGLLAVRGQTPALVDPVALSLGVAGALVVEAAFVLDTPVAAWWTRGWVQIVSVTFVLCAVVLGVWLGGPVVLAAACWGLLTYFVLLLVVLAGYWPGGGAGTDG